MNASKSWNKLLEIASGKWCVKRSQRLAERVIRKIDEHLPKRCTERKRVSEGYSGRRDRVWYETQR
jgi:hypothetical protein